MRFLFVLALLVHSKLVAAQGQLVRLHEDAKLTSSVCEGETLKLKCPPGTLIDIRSGNYGRTVPGSKMCDHPDIKDLNCTSIHSMAKVADICEGRQSCEVMAENDLFGDPCVGTFKYLEVSYVCKGDYKDLRCWHNKIPHMIHRLEGKNQVLDGDYRERKDPINKCFVAAKEHGSYDTFALGNHGQCWGGKGDNYKHYGAVKNCPEHGEGGYGILHVYGMVDTQESAEESAGNGLGLGRRCSPEALLPEDKCSPANSACITYRCKCVKYWVRSGHHCVAQNTLPLGATCRTPNAPCGHGNSICRLSRCVCKSGTVKINHECLVPSGY